MNMDNPFVSLRAWGLLGTCRVIQGETGTMFSNRLAFAALGAACIVAAAAGGYLATRQNTTPAPSTLQAGTATSANGQGERADARTHESTAQPVQQTEAIIDSPRSNSAKVERAPLKREASRRATAAPPVSRVESIAAASSSDSTRGWSAGTSSPASPAPPESIQNLPPAADVVAAARNDESRASEPARPPDPPARTIEELVVSADSVIGLQLETSVTSERARVEDRVEARVVRDVHVGGAVAIPAGSRAIGSVMAVERGGRLKERARLGIRFHTLVLADGTRLPITTETMYRNGDAPGNSSAAKIGGGAAAGAILGAIIGGAKGAAIGGSVGAGAGTASVMSGERNAATFQAGTDVTARILSPVTVTVEK